MEVLAFCSYPIEAASTRYRLIQYITPLAKVGVNLTVCPFLNSKKFAFYFERGIKPSKTLGMFNSMANRLLESFSARNFDVVLVHREAMMFGPPLFEWLAKIFGNCPLVLDLDDATYVPYVSKTFGNFGRALKFFGKTDTLIKWSDTVLCGNRFVAEYVEKKGGRAVIVPTVVDTELFCPVEKDSRKQLTVGWIGTHSTFHSLESIFPVLQDLAKKYDFSLKVVGAGKKKVDIDGIRIENLEWSLEREIEDFQSLDIGLYPIITSPWNPQDFVMGKSGFKAIEYMSVGIPFVVTPVGICSEIGIEGQTHYSASNPEEWFRALDTLLQSQVKRKKMGEQGRKYALENYTVPQQLDKITKVLREVTKKKGS